MGPFGGLALLDVQYETDHQHDFDAKATMVFGGYKATLGKRLSIGASAGIAIDGEMTGAFAIHHGSGYRLALDSDFLLSQFSGNDLIGNLGLTLDRFGYKADGARLDLAANALTIGGLIRHKINFVNLYGGLQIYLLDNNTLTSSGVFAGTSSVSRQDRFSIRLGGTADVLHNLALRLDLFLLGEQSILIGADIKI